MNRFKGFLNPYLIVPVIVFALLLLFRNAVAPLLFESSAGWIPGFILEGGLLISFLYGFVKGLNAATNRPRFWLIVAVGVAICLYYGTLLFA
jgi:hypothetical protein